MCQFKQNRWPAALHAIAYRGPWSGSWPSLTGSQSRRLACTGRPRLAVRQRPVGSGRYFARRPCKLGLNSPFDNATKAIDPERAVQFWNFGGIQGAVSCCAPNLKPKCVTAQSRRLQERMVRTMALKHLSALRGTCRQPKLLREVHEKCNFCEVPVG